MFLFELTVSHWKILCKKRKCSFQENDWNSCLKALSKIHSTGWRKKWLNKWKIFIKKAHHVNYAFECKSQIMKYKIMRGCPKSWRGLQNHEGVSKIMRECPKSWRGVQNHEGVSKIIRGGCKKSQGGVQNHKGGVPNHKGVSKNDPKVFDISRNVHKCLHFFIFI